MKFILGKKQNMVQYFDENGTSFPATLISAGPVVISQLKNVDKDGYLAVQVGYEKTTEKRTNKAQIGHLKGLPVFKHLKEFRFKGEELKEMKVGEEINASVFNKGDVVEIKGISKGKGFQGVVKRHGFKGGPGSHGQKHSEREPGSIGGGLRNRVPKGMRMAGRMGGDLIHVKNLKVLEVDSENNYILINGAIPGRRGTLIKIISK